VYQAKARKSKSEDLKSKSKSASDSTEADTKEEKKAEKLAARQIVRDHRITPSFTFISNSFSNDQFGLGFEYSFRNIFMARLAYVYEANIFSETDARNVYNGFAGGVSFELPFGKLDEITGRKKTSFGIDYSYRMTYFFDGTHTIGLRFSL
jgi:hypothetical protein